MRLEATPARIPVRPGGVLVVDGYGVRISVECGHLVVRDTLMGVARAARFARATCPLRRLVVLGHTGSITLDAPRWLADRGIGFVQFDPDGRVLTGSGGLGHDDPRLRRAQAQARGTQAGLNIAVDLLDAKLRGQGALVADLPCGEEAMPVIEACRARLRFATTPAELLVPEAAAAGAYWTAWSRVELHLATRDAAKVPEHWRTFGGRASPITGNPRSAANPANAMLNYLYAILEGEARLACLAMGLDPGLGVLHADLRARDSLALDVMEAVRPDVDAWLLALLRGRVFRMVDFFETRQGVCRIVPPLSHELAGTVSMWRQQLAPVVERVAQAFAGAPDSRARGVPTPLTGERRSAGRAGQRRSARRPVRAPSIALRSCGSCGGRVPTGRDYCDVCVPELTAAGVRRFRARGAARLAELREAGMDPGHSEPANRSRAAKRTASLEAEREWDAVHERPDPAIFRSEILPTLHGVSARTIADATGLSRPYCNAILRGEQVPHPRWWETLGVFGDVVVGSDP